MNNPQQLLNVVSDLRKLAESLQSLAEQLIETNPSSAQQNLPIAKVVTLEQVRAVLADKSNEGFTTEVRTLLEKHGAPKLSEINPANYASLFADAQRLK